MKIKLKNIIQESYEIREKKDLEYLNELIESLREDGLWNPIIVRNNKNGNYDLIAGHYRVMAAKELDWDEIEANVKDLEDIDADFLSLKTNILRLDMNQLEQGKVLLKIKTDYDLSGTEIAKKIGKSETWVNKRIRGVMSFHKSVLDALENNQINFDIASIIGSIDLTNQQSFLKIILTKKISDPSTATKLKKLFLNDTLYTIGYEGKKLIEFIKILQNNKIDCLIDVRESDSSIYKPEFSGAILQRELKIHKIEYMKRGDIFGVPKLLRDPIRENYLSFKCLEQWYKWKITTIDFKNFIEVIKGNGKCILLCMEKDATQCHRGLLANLILENKHIDSLYQFKERVDL